MAEVPNIRTQQPNSAGTHDLAPLALPAACRSCAGATQYDVGGPLLDNTYAETIEEDENVGACVKQFNAGICFGEKLQGKRQGCGHQGTSSI
eukprot:1158681-Pelagomonas_calceolata.AAC.2